MLRQAFGVEVWSWLGPSGLVDSGPKRVVPLQFHYSFLSSWFGDVIVIEALLSYFMPSDCRALLEGDQAGVVTGVKEKGLDGIFSQENTEVCVGPRTARFAVDT